MKIWGAFGFYHYCCNLTLSWPKATITVSIPAIKNHKKSTDLTAVPSQQRQETEKTSTKATQQAWHKPVIKQNSLVDVYGFLVVGAQVVYTR